MAHERTPQAPGAQFPATGDPAPQPESIEIISRDSAAERTDVAGRDTRPHNFATNLLHVVTEGLTQPHTHEDPYGASDGAARSYDSHARASSRPQILTSGAGVPVQRRNLPETDRAVPVEEKGKVSISFVFRYVKGLPSGIRCPVP